MEALCASHPKFLNKGGLCVALVVTETAKLLGLPIEPESLRTEEGGQVAGLGKAAVQKILESHGIVKILAEEGGRTSRGSLGLMEAHIQTLNGLHKNGVADLDEASAWWIGKVKTHFASEGPKFNFGPGKSLQANIAELFQQAEEVQTNGGGTNYVGAMLQHLVGAKLDFVLGVGKVDHHGFSVISGCRSATTKTQSTGLGHQWLVCLRCARKRRSTARTPNASRGFGAVGTVGVDGFPRADFIAFGPV